MRQTLSTPTGVQAVAENNYGRPEAWDFANLENVKIAGEAVRQVEKGGLMISLLKNMN